MMINKNTVNKDQYLIADANRYRVRTGETLAASQQASARKLDPAVLNKHLGETHNFFSGNPKEFTPVTEQEHDPSVSARKETSGTDTGQVAEKTSVTTEETETSKTESEQKSEKVDTTQTAEQSKPPLVAVAEKAYEQYSQELEPVKGQMRDIFGSHGEIQARAKNPVSAANRLQRVLDNGWSREISTPQQALSNLWDAIGSRVVLNDTTPAGIQKTVDSMSDAIRTGKLEITSMNNLRGPGGVPYFSPKQLKQIYQADYERRQALKAEGKEGGKPIAIGGAWFQVDEETVGKLKGEISDDRLKSLRTIIDSKLPQEEIMKKLKDMKFSDSEIEKILYHAPMGDTDRSAGSPFTSVCAYVKHNNGVTGELQIIGSSVLKIANAEHLPYDAMIKKDLYRELSPEGKTKIEPYFKPFEEAMSELTENQKKEYNEYLNQCYMYARNLELGVVTDYPQVPAGLNQNLSMQNILHIHDVYSKIKKQHPKE